MQQGKTETIGVLQVFMDESRSEFLEPYSSLKPKDEVEIR